MSVRRQSALRTGRSRSLSSALGLIVRSYIGEVYCTVLQKKEEEGLSLVMLVGRSVGRPVGRSAWHEFGKGSDGWTADYRRMEWASDATNARTSKPGGERLWPAFLPFPSSVYCTTGDALSSFFYFQQTFSLFFSIPTLLYGIRYSRVELEHNSLSPPSSCGSAREPLLPFPLLVFSLFPSSVLRLSRLT